MMFFSDPGPSHKLALTFWRYDKISMDEIVLKEYKVVLISIKLLPEISSLAAGIYKESLMPYAHNPYGSGDRAVRSIDRNREKERRVMLKLAQKHADELATRLVQRLLDSHIIETNNVDAIRDHFNSLFQKMRDMDEFDLQYKIAPLRQLAADPNFLSLYITQHIIEDLIDHPHIVDIFGDDQEIFLAVDSIMDKLRPPEE